jgi:hypothetical protein
MVNPGEASMLEILATYTAEKPTVERISDDVVRVVIHFGHNSVELIDTCRAHLSFDELDELIDLWANPNCKREYTDLPEGLLVRRVA